jgi:hypothetical protein
MVYCFSVTEENKMLTNPELSTQKFSISLSSKAVSSPLQRARRALSGRSRARFASIAGLSFALSFPVLGIVDPKVLMASGLSNVRSVEDLFQRADVALRTMDVVGAFATGGVAVLALAAMAGVGYLHSRYKAAHELPATE